MKRNNSKSNNLPNNIPANITQNRLINGSELYFYKTESNFNNNNNNSYNINVNKKKIPNSKMEPFSFKNSKYFNNLIQPEIDFIKKLKIKYKNLKELILNKFDKECIELNNIVKTKKYSLAQEKMALIEDIKWKIIQEINNIDILNKTFDKKFNEILSRKNIINNNNLSNYSLNSLNNSINNSGVNNLKKYSLSIKITSPPLNSHENNEDLSSLIQVNKTHNHFSKNNGSIKKISKNKSYIKSNINNVKNIKNNRNKSSNILKKKISISSIKSAKSISDYIKQNSENSNNVSSYLFDNNNNNNLNSIRNNLMEKVNSYKNKLDEKEKELIDIKEKLQNEKSLNKNLLYEINDLRNNKSLSKKNEKKFKEVKNKNFNDKLVGLTNKLSKVVNFVINFSNSIVQYNTEIIINNEKNKNQCKKNLNEEIVILNNLNNKLSKIHNDFDYFNKFFKNIYNNYINENINKDKNHLNINFINNCNFNTDNNIIQSNNLSYNLNVLGSNINNDLKFKDNFNIYNNSIKSKQHIEINVNSPIKEENSLDMKNDNKNFEDIKINLNDNSNYNSSNNKGAMLVEDNSSKKSIENLSLNLNNDYFKQVIKGKNRYNRRGNFDDTDSEKNKLSSSNRDKVFTFRNNSLISNKELDKADLSKNSISDINRILEENKSLKMRLASEILKNNNTFNLTNKSDSSHNDEEYEQIIDNLKQKLNEKENQVSELNVKIDFLKNNNNTSNNITIKDNFNDNLNSIKLTYDNILAEKENKISELLNEINILEKDLEELTEKFNKEKEINRKMNIKISSIESEKLSLIEEINTYKNNEKNLIDSYEKKIEILKNTNIKLNKSNEYQFDNEVSYNLNINESVFKSELPSLKDTEQKLIELIAENESLKNIYTKKITELEEQLSSKNSEIEKILQNHKIEIKDMNNFIDDLKTQIKIQQESNKIMNIFNNITSNKNYYSENINSFCINGSNKNNYCFCNNSNSTENVTNYNSTSNRQTNNLKEELILLKQKLKETIEDNSKLTDKTNDYNFDMVNEKNDFITVMKNSFIKFLTESKIDNKNKEFGIVIMKLLGYKEEDINEILQNIGCSKRGMFGLFK